MEKLIIEHAVGYMLKVMKSGVPIKKYKDEFAAIRHGNYFDFINLVSGQIPTILVYREGEIIIDSKANKEDCDFLGLLKSGPSLLNFFTDCKLVYGVVNDSDISDEIFGKVVLFEISLRMNANNNLLINKREDLINVINRLCLLKNFSQTEIDIFHKGRSFLNMIKHKKNQFSSWSEGITMFNISNELLIENNLNIW